MAPLEIQARPRGWAHSPQNEWFELSDMDHWLPKFYTQMAEVFELPPAADEVEIVNSFTNGLEYALAQFPVLAGTLHNDEAHRRLSVTKKRESSVTLVVKKVREESGGLPSFRYLDDRDYLMPTNYSHHPSPPTRYCADGDGCNTFLTTWAESTAASRRGRTLKPIVKTHVVGKQLSVNAPDKRRWQQLDKKYPILKDLGKPPPSLADAQMPALEVRMWHFPRSSTVKLKAESSPIGSGSWISTYDAIVGLLWKSITQANLPLLSPALSKTTIMGHGVSARNVLRLKSDEGYLGNALFISATSPVPIQDVSAEGNLPKLAASIWHFIKAVTPQAASEMVEWTAGLHDPRFVTIALNAFMGMNFGVTSWEAMTPYEKHDFGFGHPKALRLPHPQFEGVAFVMPSRRLVKPDAADEGIEVCICLEETSHDRLVRNPELLRYAQSRGNDAWGHGGTRHGGYVKAVHLPEVAMHQPHTIHTLESVSHTPVAYSSVTKTPDDLSKQHFCNHPHRFPTRIYRHPSATEDPT